MDWVILGIVLLVVAFLSGKVAETTPEWMSFGCTLGWIGGIIVIGLLVGVGLAALFFLL